MELTMALISILCLSSAPAQAWDQTTHKRIVLDAMTFIKNNPNSNQYQKLATGISKAGFTWEQFAETVGQGAYDVDDFADTYLCGATTGSCQISPVYSTLKIAQYTSYWHFQNHTAGSDVHGNKFGGYNYSKLTVAGDIDKLAKTWLIGDYLDDGAGGLKGWFGDSSKYNSYGLTEAHYRLGGTSSANMYADFETMPFQPLDNLGQYWWQQFLAKPSAQTLGFVMHTTDLLQPHHTWTTSANNHSGWETWVKDYYDSEQLNNPALVATALKDFTPLKASDTDIRPLLTEGGTYSYKNGGIVLSSTDHIDRARVAKQMIPHAIAMVVHVLNRAAERLAQ
ncbi:hypothetical protein ACFQNF_06190 [Iodobacter arcticus]|uniref:Phospholipase n=1 Tax=Iodobacter arcticus TaxID=590593 RepID=A0ABW2QWX1_9NEIS